MKKLIPALCLLLVSAMLMGTSTFAWFSMNTSVSANGMKVQASVPTSLVIKKHTASADSAWNSTVTLEFNSAAATLSPCTPKNQTTPDLSDFYKLTATGQDLVKNPGNPGQATVTTSANPSSDTTNFVSAGSMTGTGITGYVAKDSFDLKMASSATVSNTAIKLSTITIKNGDTDWVKIYKALRIAFKITYDGGSATYKVVDVGDGSPSSNTITISSSDTFVTLVEQEKICTVEMYVWYEGTDEDCYTNNALAADQLTIDLTFEKVAS